MKAGVRALGVADSAGEERSTVAGCVARADGVVDDFVFGRWTVGGTDATATVIDCFERLDRPDVQYLLLSGIAPAWFNLLDLRTIQETIERPTIAVSFEESEGLTAAIEAAFDDADRVERRLATYRRQPNRRRVSVNGETVFVRGVGLDGPTADDVVRTFTPAGGRPEPLRVARLAARAARASFDDA